MAGLILVATLCKRFNVSVRDVLWHPNFLPLLERGRAQFERRFNDVKQGTSLDELLALANEIIDQVFSHKDLRAIKKALRSPEVVIKDVPDPS